MRRGWVIVARNWRGSAGELDVVAVLGSMLVVCEVKARASGSHGFPTDAVGPHKQRRVRRTAVEFLTHLRSADPMLAARITEVRFDVAAVLGSVIEVLEDAF